MNSKREPLKATREEFTIDTVDIRAELAKKKTDSYQACYDQLWGDEFVSFLQQLPRQFV